jgi:plastocyanin
MRLIPVHEPASPMRRVLFAAVIGAVALIATSCSSGGDSSGAPAQPAQTEPAPSASATTAQDAGAAAATAPTIEGFAFHPDRIQVTAGQKVTWTNKDTTAHTVTASDGSFDSGSLAPGKSFSFTFDKAGTVSYHCSFHQSMVATVAVT